MLEGVLKGRDGLLLHLMLMSFNPWYVGGGVKRPTLANRYRFYYSVSILGMLEGVLKAMHIESAVCAAIVSILGMLEGVLKAWI